jgi:hypothetical protein
MKIKNILLVLLVIVLGCRDEFILESDNYDQIMVVDGMISNEPGPYTINLSLTAPINSDANIPLKGYTITLYENTGKSEILTETESGKYVTSIGGIQGIVGNEYSISIINPNGVEYRSVFQELKQPVELDSVYYEIDTTESVNYPYKIPGYQFYIDTESAITQENYFLWSITETFEYDSDYPFYAYENNSFFMFYYPKLMKLGTCWKTQNVNYLFTGSTSNLNIPKITHQPLHFVSTETKKLSKGYSILLTQYAISEKAYNYWQNMEKLLSEENFLVVTQPYNVTGNIQNINNPNEKVYGYFNVASVSQSRIFVGKTNLEMYFNICTVISDKNEIASYKQAVGPPYYWVQMAEGIGIVNLGCIDCTSEGGTIIKPKFWIDK